jgi:uncharacterized protein (DUF433 family)
LCARCGAFFRVWGEGEAKAGIRRFEASDFRIIHDSPRENAVGRELLEPDHTMNRHLWSLTGGDVFILAIIMFKEFPVAKDYVEERSGAYFVAETRVSLDSIVYAFLRGESPEGIAESFPAVTLEQILGSLAFYLANRDKIDEYLRQGAQDFERLRQQARQNNPALYARLEDSRQKANHPGA